MSALKTEKLNQRMKVTIAAVEINEEDQHEYEKDLSERTQNKKDNQGQIIKNTAKRIKKEDKKANILHKIGGITMTKAKRELNKPISVIDPGPCSYETQILPRQQSVTFTRAPAHQSVHQKNTYRVGPGSYYPQQNQKKVKKNQYTIGCKYESSFDVRNKNNPGPGQYDSLPQIMKLKQKNYSPNKGFGTSNRFSMQLSGPGPGSYQYHKKNQQSLNKKRTISNSGRQQAYKSQQVPGPANYDAPSCFQFSLKKHKGVTIGMRNNRRSQSNLTSQAFGNYTIKRQFDQGNNKHGFTIGQQKRRFIQICQTPSPQDYEANKIYSHSPEAKISQSRAIEPKAIQTPGPGTYDENGLKKSIKYSFPKSKSSSIMSVASQNPGVGKYEINQKISKVTHKGSLFSKQMRLQNNIASSVGVGDYNIGLPSQNKGITIPKANALSRIKNI